jgi:hypothetical protein
MGSGLQLSNLAIVRASHRKRLWVAAAGVVVFLATIWTSHALLAPEDPHNRGFGLDFIAFYTAGDFVREGQTQKLYDLNAVNMFEHQLAALNHFELGRTYGPWWNPPFYALVFAPFTRLPFPAATLLWLGINLVCFSLACVLLCRFLPRGMNWRSWSLVPVLAILSAPFILTVSHAQNTCTSLLLLTSTVTLWRARRPLLAGLVGGLVFYKPQVAALLALILVLDLGWRALVGYAITGVSLLLVNLIALPGTLTDYLTRLPKNVHSFQTQTPYPWEQHVTLRAFWRLLGQGHAMGDTTNLVLAAGALSALLLGMMLLHAAMNARKLAGSARPTLDAIGSEIRRDRLIAATVAATPLLMPFYFDYDLLLLAVPAVLFAAEYVRGGRLTFGRADRWVVAAWAGIYLWQMINTDVAEKTNINLSVALLTILASLLIFRVSRKEGLSDAKETRTGFLTPTLLAYVAQPPSAVFERSSK